MKMSDIPWGLNLDNNGEKKDKSEDEYIRMFQEKYFCSEKYLYYAHKANFVALIGRKLEKSISTITGDRTNKHRSLFRPTALATV